MGTSPPHPQPHLAHTAHTGTPGTDPKPIPSSRSVVQGLELPASQAGVMLPPPTPRSCFLRGSHVRFMVLPDILKNAPFFKKIDTKASKARSGTGKAKAAAKERTVGARPLSPGSYYLPPWPWPPARESAPASCTWCARAHPHTFGHRLRCQASRRRLLGRSSPCGARLAWSKSHPVPHCCAGRPTPGLPPDRKAGGGRGAGGRNPSFN